MSGVLFIETHNFAPMQEKTLVKKCKAGAVRYQRKLFDTYYTAVYGRVRRYVVRKEEAEDVVMITFQKVFRGLGRFQYQGEGSLRKWILTIAVHEALRLLKRNSRIPSMEELEQAEQVAPTREEELEIQGVSAAEVMLILKDMPVGYRTVFNLYAVEGYTHKEIAEMLGISRNTSKSQMLKARKFMLDKLSKQQVWKSQ